MREPTAPRRTIDLALTYLNDGANYTAAALLEKAASDIRLREDEVQRERLGAPYAV